MPLTMLSEWAKKAIRAPFHLVGLELTRRPSRDADDQRIFFLHLPKCGGMSVNRAMSRAFGAQRLAVLNPTASWRAAEIRGKDPMDYRTSLLFYYMSMKDVNVITGHFSWCDDAYEHFSKDWTYVTILRDPVRRWFSHYFYDRHKSGGYFSTEKNLSTFLHSERAREMGTIYARRLSGSQVTNMNQAVELAKVNLEKFEILGFLEDMDVFADQFSNYFGIKLSIPRKNTSPAKDKKEGARKNEEYVHKVRGLCKHDIEIYNHARKLVYK
jgi:hypothetical protein